MKTVSVLLRACLFLSVLFVAWTCNLSDSNKPDTLTFHLNDSLKASVGKYDSVQLDLYTIEGKDTVFKRTIFHGEYRDASQLKDLPLGEKVSGSFLVRVVAYRNDEKVLEVGVPFVDGQVAANPIVFKTPDSIPLGAKENHAPIFTSGVENQSMLEGESRRVVLKARDEDGDPLQFKVKNLDSLRSIFADGGKAIVLFSAGDSMVITFSPGLAKGNYRFQISVSDPRSAAEVQILTFSVGKVNRPPAISFFGSESGPTFHIKEGRILILKVIAKDPDSGDVASLLTIINPPWPRCGQGNYDTVTGALTFSPTFQCIGSGESTFANLAFRARDNGSPSEMGQVNASITVSDSNSAPKWKSSSMNVKGKEGKEMNFDISSVYLGDDEKDSVEFDASIGTIDKGSRVWRFVPSFLDAGLKDCEIVARDSHYPLASSKLVLKLDISDSTRIVKVAITSPKAGFISKDSVVVVHWKAEDEIQTKDTTERLKAEGPNILRRTLKDSLGNYGSDSITVYLDTKAPNAPKMSQTPYSPLNSLKPVWTWNSSGGGAKVFRCKVDGSNLVGEAEQLDSTYTPKENLSEGRHTLYVQERDEAGNWSEVGKRELVLALRGVVGSPGFSDFNVLDLSFAISKSGEKYLAYEEVISRSDTDGATTACSVKKFNGTSWEKLGEPSSLGHLFRPHSLKISSNNVPYLSLSDNNHNVIVLKFIGGAWESVSDEKIPAKSVETALAISSLGILYIAFENKVSGNAAVMRLNGNSWETMGSPTISSGTILFPDLKINSSGIPYLAYVESGAVKIQRYNFPNSTWESVGNLGLHSKDTFPISLSIDQNDSVYLAFSTAESGGDGQLYKFNGLSWEKIGDAIFRVSEGQAGTLSIGTDVIGKKYATFLSTINSSQVVMKTLRGNVWVNVGIPDITSKIFSTSSIELSPEGVPFVAVSDDGYSGRATVVKGSFDP